MDVHGTGCCRERGERRERVRSLRRERDHDGDKQRTTMLPRRKNVALTRYDPLHDFHHTLALMTARLRRSSSYDCPRPSPTTR
jgi:hypothetical protein